MKFALGILVVAAFPSVAAAQAICNDDEQIRQCWDRVTGAANDSASSAVAADSSVTKESQETRLHGKLAELGRAALGGEGFSLSDFLPIFAGVVGSSQRTTEGGAKSFQLNVPVAIGNNAKPQSIRLEALIREPTVYAPLAAKLPDSVRATRVAELVKDLDELDDVEFIVTFNLENQGFGRRFNSYVDLHSQIFLALINRAAQGHDDAALRAFVDALTIPPGDVNPTRAAAAECLDLDNVTGLRVDCLTTAKRQEIEATLRAAALSEQALDSLVLESLRSGGFFRFADLINNQPQFNIEGARRARTGLVGPNEYRLKFRYERGLKNVNTLRSHCEGGGDFADCAVDYLRDSQTIGALTRGDRIWLSAEYATVDPFSQSIPQDTVNLMLPSKWRFTGSAGFGTSLGVDADGTETGRFDLAVSAVFNKDDPTRQNRLVFSATYSQRINADLSLGVGAAYSTNSEFVGEVDKKFGTHFGVRYKLSSH